jgi:hypothetical protein
MRGTVPPYDKSVLSFYAWQVCLGYTDIYAVLLNAGRPTFQTYRAVCTNTMDSSRFLQAAEMLRPTGLSLTATAGQRQTGSQPLDVQDEFVPHMGKANWMCVMCVMCS